MTKNNKYLPYNLIGSFSYGTVVSILAKKSHQICETKVWSDPTANPQFVKDFNP